MGAVNATASNVVIRWAGQDNGLSAHILAKSHMYMFEPFTH